MRSDLVMPAGHLMSLSTTNSNSGQRQHDRRHQLLHYYNHTPSIYTSVTSCFPSSRHSTSVSLSQPSTCTRSSEVRQSSDYHLARVSDHTSHQHSLRANSRRRATEVSSSLRQRNHRVKADAVYSTSQDLSGDHQTNVISSVTLAGKKSSSRRNQVSVKDRRTDKDRKLTESEYQRQRSHQQPSAGSSSSNMLKWRYQSSDENMADTAGKEVDKGDNSSENMTSGTDGESVHSNRAATSRMRRYHQHKLERGNKRMEQQALCHSLPDGKKQPVSSRSRQLSSDVSTDQPDVLRSNVMNGKESMTPDLSSHSAAGISDVLEMVNSLKIQFDQIQSQLQISAQSQNSLEREIIDLHEERLARRRRCKHRSRKCRSLRRVALANSSQSSQSGMDNNYQPAYYDSHQDLVRAGDYLPPTASVRQSSMVTSFIANLPPPEEMEPVLSDHEDVYSSHSSEESYNPTLCHHTRQRHAVSGSRQSIDKYSSTSASALPQRRDLHLTHSDKAHSMIDLYGGISHTRISRRLLLSHQTAQRLGTLRRLAESERSYCTVLWQLLENYSKLLYSTGAICRKDVSVIFPSQLHTLYEQHCSLLKSVNRRLVNYDSCDVIGDVFYRFSHNKKIDVVATYKHYADHFPKLVRTINKLSSSSPLIRKVLSKSHRDGGVLGNTRDLIGYLVQPISRLFCYPAIVKELMANTPDQHVDIRHLESAQEFFKRNLKSMKKSLDNCIQLAGLPHFLPSDSRGDTAGFVDNDNVSATAGSATSEHASTHKHQREDNSTRIIRQHAQQQLRMPAEMRHSMYELQPAVNDSATTACSVQIPEPLSSPSRRPVDRLSVRVRPFSPSLTQSTSVPAEDDSGNPDPVCFPTTGVGDAGQPQPAAEQIDQGKQTTESANVNEPTDHRYSQTKDGPSNRPPTILVDTYVRPQTPQPLGLRSSDDESDDDLIAQRGQIVSGTTPESTGHKAVSQTSPDHSDELLLSQSLASAADFEMKLLMRQLTLSTPDLSRTDQPDHLSTEVRQAKVRFRSPLEDNPTSPVIHTPHRHHMVIASEDNLGSGESVTGTQGSGVNTDGLSSKRHKLANRLRVIFNRNSKKNMSHDLTVHNTAVTGPLFTTPDIPSSGRPKAAKPPRTLAIGPTY